MTIRFLQTVASENPEYPFLAGQVISVDTPSQHLLGLLDGVRAEVVKVDDSELAVVGAGEAPEPVRRKVRRKR